MYNYIQAISSLSLHLYVPAMPTGSPGVWGLGDYSWRPKVKAMACGRDANGHDKGFAWVSGRHKQMKMSQDGLLEETGVGGWWGTQSFPGL